MTEQRQNMYFNLSISFENIEVKGVTIDLKKFLYLNNKISTKIRNICQYNSHVNFAETLLNGMQIKGTIQTVFNHKRFINSLKKFQSKHKSTWVGNFTYNDSKDHFIFRAPSFKKKVL